MAAKRAHGGNQHEPNPKRTVRLPPSQEVKVRPRVTGLVLGREYQLASDSATGTPPSGLGRVCS